MIIDDNRWWIVLKSGTQSKEAWVEGPLAKANLPCQRGLYRGVWAVVRQDESARRGSTQRPWRMPKWVWVNTYRYIFSGMNIHLPAILGFTRYQGFDPSPNPLNFNHPVTKKWACSKKRSWVNSPTKPATCGHGKPTDVSFSSEFAGPTWNIFHGHQPGV